MTAASDGGVCCSAAVNSVKVKRGGEQTNVGDVDSRCGETLEGNRLQTPGTEPGERRHYGELDRGEAERAERGEPVR